MKDFVREFLFGDAGITRDGAGVRSEIVMDLRTEGWIGIPHGGISMGAIADLFESLHETRNARGLPYPVTMNIRMGGSRLRTGETVHVAVAPEGEGAKGIVSVRGSEMPYLEADITRGFGPETSEAQPCLPSSFDRLEGALSALPFYRNCFVCGIDRSHPGLKRKFQLFEAARQNRVVVSCAGFDAADMDTVHRFERGGRVHPVALMALVDETMGWAGFMNYASGAVTVRLSATLHREIILGEKFVVFGRGERVRGTGSRMLFWASGGIAVVGQGGAFETVVTASSQFLGVPALTEQMRTELIPQELTRRAFAIAESGLP
jgi:acyl-coenzyme A thioesterase PaaI-like protein